MLHYNLGFWGKYHRYSTIMLFVLIGLSSLFLGTRLATSSGSIIGGYHFVESISYRPIASKIPWSKIYWSWKGEDLVFEIIPIVVPSMILWLQPSPKWVRFFHINKRQMQMLKTVEKPQSSTFTKKHTKHKKNKKGRRR